MKIYKGPETSGNGEFHYYYNREERLAKFPGLRESCYDEKKKSGFFRMLRSNKSLMFLLIDVLILSLLFLVYIFFFTGPNEWKTGDAFFTLTAYANEDKVLASLKMTLTSDGAEPLPEVSFLVDERKEEKVRESIRTGKEIVFRSVLAREDKEKIRCVILYDGERKILSAKIRN